MEQEQESQTEQQEPIHLPKEYQNNPHFFLSKKVLLPDPIEAIDEEGIEEHEEDSNQNEQSSIIEKREDVEPSRIIPSKEANDMLYMTRLRGKIPKGLRNDPDFMRRRKEACEAARVETIQMVVDIDVKVMLQKLMIEQHLGSKCKAIRFLVDFYNKYKPIEKAVEAKMREEVLLIAAQQIK